MRALLLVLALCLGYGGQARAGLEVCPGEVWISATLRSYHFDRPNEYEETNLGIGLETGRGSWRCALGVYRNSHRKVSLYGGASWLPLAWRGLRLGVFGGVFAGYGNDDLLPAGAGVLAWEGERFGVNLLWFPPFEESKGLLVLQVKRLF